MAGSPAGALAKPATRSRPIPAGPSSIAPPADTAPVSASVRWAPGARPRRMNRPRSIYLVRAPRGDGNAHSFLRIRRPGALRLARALRAQGADVEVYRADVGAWSPVDIPAGRVNGTAVAE